MKIATLHSGTCPDCLDHNVEGRCVEVEPFTAHQICSCDDCGSQWRNEYVLSDSAVLESGDTQKHLTAELQCQESKLTIERLLDAVGKQIERVPKKGDTSETCQQTALKVALNELHACVNGLSAADFVDHLA